MIEDPLHLNSNVLEYSLVCKTRAGMIIDLVMAGNCGMNASTTVRYCRVTVLDPFSWYGSRQTSTPLSDGVLCQMKVALARFVSHATHCPMVMSFPVRCVTVFVSGSVP